VSSDPHHAHSPDGDPFLYDRDVLLLRCGDPDCLRIAGADEAGRGSLAGPIVAAAVVLDYASHPQDRLHGLTDSKQLSRSERERLYREILKVAAGVSCVACAAGSIDRYGLQICNIEVLGQALGGVENMYDCALVDGFELKRPELRADAVIGGDCKSAAVAAASVVAKVVRDRVMWAMAPTYPEYGFESHVGYGTAAHRQALIRYGPCSLHRLSFSGVGSAQLDLWDSSS